MGSIGQYPGVLDYISNVYVHNVTLVNGQNGARLKAWAGRDKGYGYIRNVTFDDLTIQNTDRPIGLDQCYINVTPQDCAAYPSRVNISDIKFLHIRGTSSGARDSTVGSLKCSPAAECKDIVLEDINLRSPEDLSKNGNIVCEGIKGKVGICKSEAEVDDD
jgi:galacturan 1,4-alpha-galacturonidase